MDVMLGENNSNTIGRPSQKIINGGGNRKDSRANSNRRDNYSQEQFEQWRLQTGILGLIDYKRQWGNCPVS